MGARTMVWAVGVALAALAAPAAWAQDESKPVSQEEFLKLKKELEELTKKMGGVEGDPSSMAVQDPDDAKRKAGQVYSKPFLARFGGRVHIGGYLDMEYIGTESSNDDTFDQHRLVPFIYADVTDDIKIATEIEIEHGGELGVEFAHVDWWMAESFNFRAGIILDPLGKLNLVHDAPFQDLTFRPLVDEFVIPVVLREPGVGFFGSFDADPWKIDYEVYVVNGFKGLDESGNTVISASKGLRDARPHEDVLGTKGYRDFNDNKAVVGRVGISPFLGLEVGGSFHHGKYDERGDNDLTILALDWTLSGGGIHNAVFGGGAGTLRDILFAIEIVGEYASASLDRDSLAEAALVPESLDGYYAEFRYHFMPEFLRQAIPGTNDESTFTAILRWDAVDLDGSEQTRLTVGLNYRPWERTVIKLEYGMREESGDLNDVDNDQVAASIATYF